MLPGIVLSRCQINIAVSTSFTIMSLCHMSLCEGITCNYKVFLSHLVATDFVYLLLSLHKTVLGDVQGSLNQFYSHAISINMVCSFNTLRIFVYNTLDTCMCILLLSRLIMAFDRDASLGSTAYSLFLYVTQ